MTKSTDAPSMPGSPPSGEPAPLTGALTGLQTAPFGMPRTGTDPLTVTVAICTYRRAAILDALRSLAQQQLRNIRLQVLVIDNDDHDRARAAIELTAADLALDLRYRHVPGSNISLARNACLEACETDWLAFIDDDETATGHWLQRLMDRAAEMTNIAAVFGPMRAIYGATAPAWLTQGDFHSTAIVFVEGEIRTGYTTNALINLRHPAVEGKRFNLALGKTGGEDTDFFDRVYRDGGRFGYAETALVEEVLPLERQSLRWFLQRRFRSGQTHGRILARQHQGIARLPQIMIAAGKALLCFGMVVANIIKPVTWRRWLLRGTLHLGVIARLLGRQEVILYGQSGYEQKSA